MDILSLCPNSGLIHELKCFHLSILFHIKHDFGGGTGGRAVFFFFFFFFFLGGGGGSPLDTLSLGLANSGLIHE